MGGETEKAPELICLFPRGTVAISCPRCRSVLYATRRVTYTRVCMRLCHTGGAWEYFRDGGVGNPVRGEKNILGMIQGVPVILFA